MSDQIVYDKPFKFDELVTSCFGDMLKRSVPEHDTMRELVSIVGEKYVKPNTNIVDVGCSWGDAAYPFVRNHAGSNQFKLYDVSESMLAVCRDRFFDFGCVSVESHDIREGIDVDNVSLILSILTVQFTPIEQRHKILKSMHDALNDGGALIYVEKVLGDTTDVNEMLVKSYYETKANNGYTKEQIESKRLSLEGVLVPITAKWNEDLLRKSGFSQVECFWRSLNFAGWVAVK